MSSDQSRPAVVIPAYKPSHGLVELVRALIQKGVSAIVVVDDGGGPAFGPIFEQVAAFPEVVLLRHAVNLGKGAALKTAFNFALCSMPGISGVVTADADGQHDPDDILRVGGALADHPDALVLGCRKFHSSVPLRSRIGNIATSRIMHALMGKRLSDTQTGLRGVPLALLPRLMRVEATGYEFELEMLLAAHGLAMPIVEIPIRTIYEAGNKSSHFNPVIDSMKIYFVLLRFGSVSLMTAVLDNLIFILAQSRGLDVLPAQALGRTLAVIFNYFMVRRTVFNTRQAHATVLPKYLALVVISGSASYAGIRLLGSKLGISPIPAKLLVESFLFFVNFAVQRLLIFRERNRESSKTERRQSILALVVSLVFAVALFAEFRGFHGTPLFSQDLWLPIGLTRLERFSGAFLALAIPILLMFPWAFTGFFAILVIALTAISVGPLPVLAVTFFLVSACALGCRILRVKQDAAEDQLLATLLGAGVYLFLMTWLARLPVNTIWLWGSVLATPMLIDSRGVMTRLRHWTGLIRGAELRDAWERAAFGLVVFLLVAHWLVALKPETSADGLAMHLAIPMNIAAHHQLTYEPARFLWAVMPMGADWCFSIVYLFGGEYATHLLVWTFLVLLSGLLFRLLTRVASRALSWLLVATFLATPLVQLVTGSLFVENLLALMILGAVAAIWRFRETGERRFFYLSAALGGSAMAIKVGAAAFLIPSMVFLAVETARRWKKLGARRWVMPMAGVALFSANAIPAYTIAYVRTGNPVFPFRNEKWQSPLIDPGIDIRDVRFRQPLRWNTLYDLTFQTHRYYEGQDGSLGFAYLVIIPMALASLAMIPAAAAVSGVIALTASLLVFNSEPNARYLYAALPLFLAPFGALLGSLAKSHRGLYRVAILFVIASSTLGIYFISSASYYHKDFCLRLPFSRAERKRYVAEAAPVRDVIDYYSRAHPGTPILLTAESTVAGLEAEVYENHWHQASTLGLIRQAASTQELLDLLKRWNIGYLLAYKPGMAEKPKPSTLAKILETCTVPEYERGEMYLARLDPGCDPNRAPRPPDHPVVVLRRGSYDDFDPAFLLRGEWSKDESFKEAQRQSITYSDFPGAEIAFAFEGQAWNWIYTRAHNRGIADVFIDGVRKETVDMYASKVEWQSQTRYCCFTPGRHEVVIRVSGSKNPKSSGRFVDLDGVFIE